MKLSLRPAVDEERAFCMSLNRRNMGGYLVTRGIAWDPDRFLASWLEFENLVILADSDVVGLLRLVPEQDALGLRDLQVLPQRQGQSIGTWAVQQAQAIAVSRNILRLQLRVYEENPARALYDRLGFKTESVAGGTVHMAWAVPPNNSFKPNPLRGSA
ncbi:MULTISPECIES: GNAT family N-acetyltransferase [unclassified Lysobacter]